MSNEEDHGSPRALVAPAAPAAALAAALLRCSLRQMGVIINETL